MLVIDFRSDPSPTSMSGVKIPLVGTQAQKLGGDEGARTPDLDSAIVALSQLSYIPEHGR